MCMSLCYSYLLASSQHRQHNIAASKTIFVLEIRAERNEVRNGKAYVIRTQKESWK